MAEETIFLLNLPATRTDRRLALAITAFSILVFAVTAPFARVPLTPVPAFIPAYEAALGINETITAILLFGQAVTLRSRALLALASGYLFTALIVVPHALSFPGVFSAQGWLGAGPQTTVWLFMYWHTGFPLFVIGYVALKRRDRVQGAPGQPMRMLVSAAIAAVAALVVAFTALATAGQNLLPAIMQGNAYAPGMFGVASTAAAVSFAALLVLRMQRTRVALDLWLMVVVCAWIFDIALSAVLNGARYDLGFYAARIYGLLAASFVLLVLLLETRALYTRLIRSLAAERAEISSRAQTLEERVQQRTLSLEQEIEERRKISETLEALVQQSALAILALDPERRVILWNPSAERIFGYTAEEVLGKPYPLVPLEEQGAHDRLFERFAAGEHIQGGETVRRRKDGSPVTLIFSGTPLYDREQRFRGIVFMLEDATERKALELQLRQSQKMEAIGQLTGGVAHDFNNLLGIIIGSLDLLYEQLGTDDAELRKLTEASIRAAERGAGLTRSLLAFARKQPLNPSLVEANALLAEIADMLRRTLGETIEIMVEAKAGLWGCEVDPAQLQNALINLTVNARDAMPGGGKLTIETGNVILDQDYADVHAEVIPGDYVCLAVSDTGTGMPPEVITRAFDPFFTTKKAGEGTGLGLSMIYGFAKQSSGHVKIYSEVGVGTTIKLYLPKAKEAAQAAENTAPAENSRGDETVLVVEDSGEVRGLVVQVLGKLGYKVLETANATDALSVIQQEPAIDLLLTDVVLGAAMNGCELAEQAKSMSSKLKVLFMSGYTENAMLHQGRLDRGVHLLQKPFRKAELASKIREALAS